MLTKHHRPRTEWEQKRVRFDLTPKTESDRIWLGKTKNPSRTLEAQRTPRSKKSSNKEQSDWRRSSKPSTPKWAGDGDRRGLPPPAIVATGLSAVAATLEAKKERDKRRTSVRNHRGSTECPQHTSSTPRRSSRREDRTEGGRPERKPKRAQVGEEVKVRRVVYYVWT